MPRPICVKCNEEFKVEKNGVSIYAGKSRDGRDHFWSADLWTCPSCKVKIIHGYGADSWPPQNPQNVWDSGLVKADLTKMKFSK